MVSCKFEAHPAKIIRTSSKHPKSVHLDRLEGKQTYVVDVSFHVQQSQGLLQKHYQQPRGHFVGAKLVGLNIGLLGEHEGAVAEACYFRIDL